MENNTLIIAEIGQAHDGSLGVAHSYIDAVAETGADAVKFQLHIAKEESTSSEQFRANFSFQDKSRYEYWERMEFSFDQWLELRNHAKERDLLFIVSPFSEKAVDIIEEIDSDYIKIGSGEVFSPSLIKRAMKTNIPIIASTGMSSFTEINELENTLAKGGKENYSLLHCTSEYPVQPDNIGFNVLLQMKKQFECPIGFSDHSGNIASSIAAMVLGAEIIEVHVTFSKDIFGPDVSSSLTLSELNTLVQSKKFLEKSLNSQIDKSVLASSLKDMRYIFQKKVITKRNLVQGDILKDEDLVFLKAKGGIPEADLDIILGRELKTDLKKGTILEMKHFK
ncbi:MAG: N-acetylneuraminate synthase [Candidatus Marinimicrobia bacterium]|nr:N-acetylneuraminate synthase [Candidatus Neomarinimicrobiota bacterium]|tara:strand:+ start:3506 stop:4516 length:1011 start_codon:yes stop_codon:yes gene_type:complete